MRLSSGQAPTPKPANQTPAVEHQPPIKSGLRIAPGQSANVDALVELLDIAHAEDIGSDDLELRARDRSAIARRFAGYMRGDDCRLLQTRRDQTVDVAVVFGAFAGGIDVRVRRLHRVVDGDAAADRDAGVARELDIGTDAGADDDGVARERLAG